MTLLRNFKRLFHKFLRQPGYAFGVGFKRLRASFYYNFGNGKSSYPEAITFFLTYKCNLRCKMCGQWGEGGVTKKQGTQHIHEELSFKQIKSIIDDMSRFKPNITLFGGEPLLYPHFLEAAKYIKEKRMHCLVITNGLFLESFAEAIVDSGLDELNISLDGVAKLHDEIRGMPGLFDRIMVGIKKVNYFKALKNKKRPLINLQCTITKHNYKFLEQMLDVAKEAEAVSLTYHNLIFISKEALQRQKKLDDLLVCSSGDWEGFVFDPKIDVDLLYEKIKAIRLQKHSFSVDFYPNFSYSALLEYYNNSDYALKGYSSHCLSPWIAAYVFPDGELRPCLNSSYSFGNLKEHKLMRLWNSSNAMRYRLLLKKSKIFPACIRCTELYRY